MVSIQDFKEDIGLLVEAGMIAIKQGDEESAKKLFNAVGVIDPQNNAKKMGYGLIALHKMDIKNAQKAFHEILQAEPNNHRAQAFLGFSYILSVLQEGMTADEKIDSLKKGAELATQVVEKADSPSTKQLAQSLLDWESELQDKSSTGIKPVR
jgi:tetratricopeptide (TPR) repeat protein